MSNYDLELPHTTPPTPPPPPPPSLHAAPHPCTLIERRESVSVLSRPAASLLIFEDHGKSPVKEPSKPLYWIMPINRLSLCCCFPQAPMQTLLSPNLICISIFSVHSQRCPPCQLSSSPRCLSPNIRLRTPPRGAPIPLPPPCRSLLHPRTLLHENGTRIETETRKRKNTKEGLGPGHVPDPKQSTRYRAHTAATRGPGINNHQLFLFSFFFLSTFKLIIIVFITDTQRRFIPKGKCMSFLHPYVCFMTCPL